MVKSNRRASRPLTRFSEGATLDAWTVAGDRLTGAREVNLLPGPFLRITAPAATAPTA